MAGYYRYRAKNRAGETVESITYGLSKEEVAEKISSMGYKLMEISDAISASDADRRVFSRLDNKVYVRYKLFKKTKADTVDDFEPELVGMTKNLSAGGLLFNTTERLRQGAVINLSLELPEEKIIQCMAIVVRVKEIEKNRDYETAICFLDLLDSDRARLNRYVVRGG